MNNATTSTLVNFLRLAALWSWDWMRTAMHDPEFQSYRIAWIRLLWFSVRLKTKRIEIDVNWMNCPRVLIFHPIEQAGLRRERDYPVKFAYPIDYDEIPF